MKQSNAQDRNLYQILTYQKHPNITVSFHAPYNYTDRSIQQKTYTGHEGIWRSTDIPLHNLNLSHFTHREKLPALTE